MFAYHKCTNSKGHKMEFCGKPNKAFRKSLNCSLHSTLCLRAVKYDSKSCSELLENQRLFNLEREIQSKALLNSKNRQTTVFSYHQGFDKKMVRADA